MSVASYLFSVLYTCVVSLFPLWVSLCLGLFPLSLSVGFLCPVLVFLSCLSLLSISFVFFYLLFVLLLKFAVFSLSPMSLFFLSLLSLVFLPSSSSNISPLCPPRDLSLPFYSTILCCFPYYSLPPAVSHSQHPINVSHQPASQPSSITLYPLSPVSPYPSLSPSPAKTCSIYHPCAVSSQT